MIPQLNSKPHVLGIIQLRHNREALLATLTSEYARRGKPLEAGKMNASEVVSRNWATVAPQARQLRALPLYATVPYPDETTSSLALASAASESATMALPAPSSAAPAAYPAVVNPLAANPAPAWGATPVVVVEDDTPPEFYVKFTEGAWNVVRTATGSAVVLPLVATWI